VDGGRVGGEGEEVWWNERRLTMPEEQANIVTTGGTVSRVYPCAKDLEEERSLFLILQPSGGETLIAAAKRCAAMAVKLPKAQRKARLFLREARLFREALRAWKETARLHDERAKTWERYYKGSARLVRNWLHKATRIAAALGIRDGETLVEAAERVAKQTNYADLIRRAEEAEAEAAKWKNDLAGQQLSTEKGRFLVGPWMVDRDEWKKKAEQFATEAAAWKGHAEQFAADFYRPILAALGVSEALTFKGACERVLEKLNAASPKPHEAPLEANLPYCCHREMREECLDMFMCDICGKGKRIPRSKREAKP
jgi:hypothetical protein